MPFLLLLGVSVVVTAFVWAAARPRRARRRRHLHPARPHLGAADAQTIVHRLRGRHRRDLRGVPGVHLVRALRDVRDVPPPGDRLRPVRDDGSTGHAAGETCSSRGARARSTWRAPQRRHGPAGGARRWPRCCSCSPATPTRWFAPMLPLAFGQGLTLPHVTASAVRLAPGYAGIASSVLGFVQQAIGALAVQATGFFSASDAGAGAGVRPHCRWYRSARCSCPAKPRGRRLREARPESRLLGQQSPSTASSTWR